MIVELLVVSRSVGDSGSRLSDPGMEVIDIMVVGAWLVVVVKVDTVM